MSAANFKLRETSMRLLIYCNMLVRGGTYNRLVVCFVMCSLCCSCNKAANRVVK